MQTVFVPFVVNQTWVLINDESISISCLETGAKFAWIKSFTIVVDTSSNWKELTML